MASTAALTEKFISTHLSIKDCLKKGLINYSALSKFIAKQLGLEKKASREAIAIAAIRFKDKIENKQWENNVIKLFKKSNLEIKNNIVAFTLEKHIYPDSLLDIEREIKKDKALFFAIEGTKTITVIVQQQDKQLLEKLKNYTTNKKEGLSLITITSPGIGATPGAVAYISSLFFENGVNIEEFMSCYDDTLIVINSKDTSKIMEFLEF